MQNIAHIVLASDFQSPPRPYQPLFELATCGTAELSVPPTALFDIQTSSMSAPVNHGAAAASSVVANNPLAGAAAVSQLFPRPFVTADLPTTAFSSTLTDFSRLSTGLQAEFQTERQAEQAELKRLQHILQALPTGVVVLDGRGVVQHANPVAIDMLGEPLIWQRWLDVITRSFRPRSDDGLEVSLHDGRRVQLAISALEQGAGQLIVLTDLTETRQLQSRIAHLQRLSALGKMMASLAHQIRTPLSSAMLYAQNLNSQKLAPQARVQFQFKLLQRLQDLEQQVNDLLLFARSGREQQVAPLSMQQLLNEVHSSVETLVQQEQGSIVLELPDPDLAVLGNHSALCGALGNLIQNALQHAGPGARIELSAVPAKDGQHLVLAVEDAGPGVPKALQQQIFEPFFTTRSSGTGLGLAVVQAVAHSHHGSVRCVDGKAGGARFEMILPVITPQLSTTSTFCATADARTGQSEELSDATH